jgi:hypothetical protein
VHLVHDGVRVLDRLPADQERADAADECRGSRGLRHLRLGGRRDRQRVRVDHGAVQDGRLTQDVHDDELVATTLDLDGLADGATGGLLLRAAADALREERNQGVVYDGFEAVALAGVSALGEELRDGLHDERVRRLVPDLDARVGGPGRRERGDERQGARLIVSRRELDNVRAAEDGVAARLVEVRAVLDGELGRAVFTAATRAVKVIA